MNYSHPHFIELDCFLSLSISKQNIIYFVEIKPLNSEVNGKLTLVKFEVYNLKEQAQVLDLQFRGFSIQNWVRFILLSTNNIKATTLTSSTWLSKM